MSLVAFKPTLAASCGRKERLLASHLKAGGFSTVAESFLLRLIGHDVLDESG